MTQVICLTGPESSGKSTLAEALANVLKAPLLPELARCWLTGTDPPEQNVQLLSRLALAQQEQEQMALSARPPWLLLDTDILVLEIWWRERFSAAGERVPSWLRDARLQRSPRRYLLCQPDMPWEPDPLRQNPHDRDRLFDGHLRLHERDVFPWRIVSGSVEARLEQAMTWLVSPDPIDGTGEETLPPSG